MTKKSTNLKYLEKKFLQQQARAQKKLIDKQNYSLVQPFVKILDRPLIGVGGIKS